MEESRADLTRLLAPSTACVDLRSVVFNLGTVKLVAQKLPELKCCETLNLSGCYLGGWVSYIADALPTSHILTLDLSTNYIGEAGADILARVLHRTKVTCLDLWANGIGDAGLTVLVEVLPHTRITSLNLRSNRLTRVSMRALARYIPLSNLTCLILRNNSLKDAGVKLLVQNLHMSSVEVLILEGTGMRDPGLLAIAAPSIDNIGTKSVTGEKRAVLPNSWLKSAMKQVITGCRLTSLDVSFNLFTSESMAGIGPSLCNMNLTSLNLRNCGLDDTAVRHLAQGVKDSLLTTLVLEGNRITTLEPFISGLVSSPIVSINFARNLLQLPSVEKLQAFLLCRKDSADDSKVKSFQAYHEYQSLERTYDVFLKELPATQLRSVLIDDGKVEAHPPPNPAVLVCDGLQQRMNETVKKLRLEKA